MKLNSKAFTVVELIASFALTMVITILLFQIVLQVKNIYQKETVQTAINERTSVIAKNIRKVIPADRSKSITSCGGTSCNIDGTIIKQISNTKIQIGNQKFNMPKTVTIKSFNFSNLICTPDSSNCYIKFEMTLSSDNLEDDYKYNVVFSY